VNIDGHVHLGRWSDERFFGVEASIDDVERALIGAGLDGAAVTATDLRRNDSVLSSLDRARERGSASEVRVRYWFFPWVDVNDVGMMDFVGHHIDRIDGLKFHSSSTLHSIGLPPQTGAICRMWSSLPSTLSPFCCTAAAGRRWRATNSA